jgi:hypothetical protein
LRPINCDPTWMHDRPALPKLLQHRSRFPSNGPNFDADSSQSAAHCNRPDSAEFSCQGIVVMGNIFSWPSTADRIQPSRVQCDADQPDSDLDSDVVSLLEENARLRALVTQLSDLVLRHVVGQK